MPTTNAPSTATAPPQPPPPPPTPGVPTLIPSQIPSKTLSTSASPSTSSPSAAPRVDYSCLHATSWLVNTNGNYNPYFKSSTDVVDSHITNKGKYWSVIASRIPLYNNIFTTADIQKLNSRPKASTDFVTGKTTAVAGHNYTFGTNINYVKNKGDCALGYWPPGPICPAAQNLALNFTITPAPATSAGVKYRANRKCIRILNRLLVQTNRLLHYSPRWCNWLFR